MFAGPASATERGRFAPANPPRSEIRERLAISAIVTGGILTRLFLGNVTRITKPYLSESHYVAMSLARTGRFADPFGYASGATAHVGLLTPLLSALVYRVIGADRPLAEFILSCWAALLVSLAIWLCWRLACLLDVNRAARISAAAFVALVPLQFNLEIREGRNWEVNLATVLLIWILFRLVNADAMGATKSDLAVTGALTGLLFILSPPAGLAAILAVALFHAFRLSPAQLWIAPVCFVLVAGALAGFWAERNLRALGEPVALRDNLGLELAIANYPGAVHPGDESHAYVERMKAIHPIQHASGPQAMRAAGGEIAYYRNLGRQARDWIVAHPWDFLALCARRLREFFLPPKWFWSPYGTPVNLAGLRQSLIWICAIAGLGTAIAMAFERRAYAYILVAVLTCGLAYCLVQPTLRYRYLVSTILIFLAFDGIGWLIIRIRGAPR